VQKQKSNGHLNGHAKPSSAESLPSTPPLPGTPPPGNGHVRRANSADNVSDHKMPVDMLRRPSVSGYSEESSSDSYNTPSISISHENHRRIDVNAAKNPAVHRDSGPLNLALTVLKSCPLYDTIAILIVLLQIPPTFVSIVHILFATLTFVPPLTTASSGLSWPDIFEGALGTPSVATIVSVDLVVLIIWIFLWSPLQDIALDLAQSVIALTLGGGSPTGKEASKNNVLVCLGIIGVSRFARSRHIKPSGLRHILSSSQGFLGSTDPDDPLESTPPHHSGSSAHIWIRNVLAVHILTQGVVRWVRDFLLSTKRNSSASSIGDPEAAKESVTNGNDTSTNIQTDSEPSSTLPVSNVTASKKKRKQSAQVRIRQPLWAALASTKIVMVKEYETSHTAAESAGTNATDINNLGNAPFNTEADRIWITYVGADEIRFNTSYFPTHASPETEERVNSCGVDTSKPFYVKVNKTIWQPTRINVTKDPDQAEARWTGEIYGLAPRSSYDCEFISTDNDDIIFTTNVRTLQPPADITTSNLSPTPPLPGRPSSPTSGLKISIASTEAMVIAERNRQKSLRKEQARKLNAARKENEKIVASIASAGGNDDRLRQKIQQSNLRLKQADDQVIILTKEIDEFDSNISADTAAHSLAKSTYEEHKITYSQARSAFETFKANAERSIASLQSELTTLLQKREKQQARISKLAEQHDRITDANAKGLDEAQRKASERQVRVAERARAEMFHLERENIVSNQIAELTTSLHAVYSAIDSLNIAMQVQQQQGNNGSPTQMQMQLAHALPMQQGQGQQAYTDISEGMLPVSSTSYAQNPWNSHPAYAQPPGMGGMGFGAIGTGAGPSQRTRGRSSSMLSMMSGFTQSSGEAESSSNVVAGIGNGNGKGVGGNPWHVTHSQSQQQFGSIGEGSGSGNEDREKALQRKESDGSASGSGSGEGERERER